MYLASPSASFVTGQTIVIDGGQVLPLKLSLYEFRQGVATSTTPKRC